MSAITLLYINASSGASTASNTSDLESGALSIVPSDTTPSSITTGIAHNKWTIADIHYLTSILYPEQTLNNTLTFVPALSTLHDTVAQASLKLYATIYPLSSTLLAESAENCTSKASVFSTFIHSLFSDPLATSALCARYNVLASLYLAPSWCLESLLRGMRLLATTPAEELLARRWQLEEVGEEHVLEARLEAYWLWCREEELDGWVRVGEDILGTGVEEREKMGDVYRGAVEYLREVFWKVVG